VWCADNHKRGICEDKPSLDVEEWPFVLLLLLLLLLLSERIVA